MKGADSHQFDAVVSRATIKIGLTKADLKSDLGCRKND